MYEIKTNGTTVLETQNQNAAYAMLAEKTHENSVRKIEMNEIGKDGNTGWKTRTPIHVITK